MTDGPIWVYVASDGDMTAYDSRDRALDAARDDPGPFHIEPATYYGPHGPTGAPSAAGDDEDAPDSHPSTPSAAYRRTWISPPGLIYPERPRGETA